MDRFFLEFLGRPRGASSACRWVQGRAGSFPNPGCPDQDRPALKKPDGGRMRRWRVVIGASFGALFPVLGFAQSPRILKDIQQGAYSSRPSSLNRLGSRRVVFLADDKMRRQGIWVTDGSWGGTRNVGYLKGGLGTWRTKSLVLSGGRVFFMVDDGVRGGEPWVWFPGATARPMGWGTGSMPELDVTDPVLGKTMVMSLSGIPRGGRVWSFSGRLPGPHLLWEGASSTWPRGGSSLVSACLSGFPGRRW